VDLRHSKDKGIGLPVGESIADKIGGVKSLYIFYGIVVVLAIMGISFVKTRWRTAWGVQAGGMI
jgi:uncharacterized transporter YbjL